MREELLGLLGLERDALELQVRDDGFQIHHAAVTLLDVGQRSQLGFHSLERCLGLLPLDLRLLALRVGLLAL